MRIAIRGLLAAFVVALAGCASAPSMDAMKADTANYQVPVAPREGRAMVYVVRPSSMGTLIRFNVFVDNEEAESEVGYTRGAQYIYFSVGPGSRKIMSKAENWSEVSFDVKAGDVVYLRQDVSMGLIMARNTISRMDDVTGKYYVKNLSLGTLLKEGR